MALHGAVKTFAAKENASRKYCGNKFKDDDFDTFDVINQVSPES